MLRLLVRFWVALITELLVVRALLWRSSEVCLALGLDAAGAEWQAEGVSIDSRSVEAGDIFVALRGESFDGHDFIAVAVSRGAIAVIGERLGDYGVPFLLADDSLQALTKLAAAARHRFTGQVVGITGSVGKTTCKEMLSHILRKLGSCHANQGNLNNHIGLPLALANLPADADFGVFEMGMNHAGEIKALTSLLRPHLACISNIRAVHLEHFTDLRAIAEAKAEIFLSQPQQALIGGDSAEMLNYLRGRAQACGVGDIRSFGVDTTGREKDDYRLLKRGAGEDGGLTSWASGECFGREFTFALASMGAHMALGGLAAFALVDMLLGGPALAPALDPSWLADFTAPKGRGALSQIALGGGEQALLIDESYNASPASVVASLELLAEIGNSGGNGERRRLAILGDMLELGKGEMDYHRDLAKNLQACRIDKLIAVGKLMRYLYESVPLAMRLASFDNAEELLYEIGDLIADDDIVLLKASHSVGLDRVVEYLKTIE